MSFRALAGSFYRQLTPEPLATRLDILRASYYWKKHRICFIHIPKNAGISVSSYLYRTTLGHITADNVIKYFPLAKTYYKFAVFRPIFPRFISAVSYLNKNKHKLALDRGLPPKECVENNFYSTSRVLDWLYHKRHSLHLLNPIFHSQSSYISNNSTLLVDDLIHIDKLNDFMTEVVSPLAGLSSNQSINRLNTSYSVSNDCAPDFYDCLLKIYCQDALLETLTCG